MKRYIKDGIIKTRNQIVIKGQRTIKDKDGNEKVVGTNTYNPTEEMILADGWEEYNPVVISADELVPEDDRAMSELGSGDYKVIKCMEAFLCGEPMPYDIAALHAERQTLREIINKQE